MKTNLKAAHAMKDKLEGDTHSHQNSQNSWTSQPFCNMWNSGPYEILRDQWKNVAQKTKDPHAWSVYKNLCQEVKHEIRTAEKTFIAEQVVNNKNNSNCLWRAIRLCIPKKSASQRNYSKDDKIVADEFNNFFSRVGKSTKLAEESNYTLNQCSFISRIYPLSEQFTSNAVKCKQVQTIVTSMASGKAPGTDKIPIHVIKDCLPAILPSLTTIINATFEFDIFPFDE